jgi:hypothetical protein
MWNFERINSSRVLGKGWITRNDSFARYRNLSTQRLAVWAACNALYGSGAVLPCASLSSHIQVRFPSTLKSRTWEVKTPGLTLSEGCFWGVKLSSTALISIPVPFLYRKKIRFSARYHGPRIAISCIPRVVEMGLLYRSS